MRTVERAFLLLLCLGAPLGARETAFVLPSLDRSARAMAVGEGGSFLTGVDALGVNPAGLAGGKRQWSGTYRRMPLDTSLNSASISSPLFSPRTTAAVSYTALRSAGLERRNEAGDRSGEFRQEDQTVGIHLAQSVDWGNAEISGGVSVRGIQSRIDRYSGTGLAVDIGLQHRLRVLPLTLSAAALQWGKGPKLLNDRSALPMSWAASAAYRAWLPFTLIGGVSCQPRQDVLHATLGGEYRLGSVMALRGHYAVGKGAEGNSGIGQLVAGMGVSLGNFNLDYAFQPAGEELSQAGAPPTQHATLTFNF